MSRRFAVALPDVPLLSLNRPRRSLTLSATTSDPFGLPAPPTSFSLHLLPSLCLLSRERWTNVLGRCDHIHTSHGRTVLRMFCLAVLRVLRISCVLRPLDNISAALRSDCVSTSLRHPPPPGAATSSCPLLDPSHPQRCVRVQCVSAVGCVPHFQTSYGWRVLAAPPHPLPRASRIAATSSSDCHPASISPTLSNSSTLTPRPPASPRTVSAPRATLLSLFALLLASFPLLDIHHCLRGVRVWSVSAVDHGHHIQTLDGGCVPTAPPHPLPRVSRAATHSSSSDHLSTTDPIFASATASLLTSDSVCSPASDSATLTHSPTVSAPRATLNSLIVSLLGSTPHSRNLLPALLLHGRVILAPSLVVLR